MVQAEQEKLPPRIDPGSYALKSAPNDLEFAQHNIAHPNNAPVRSLFLDLRALDRL